MPILHVYSRQGCHLCEVLIEQLLPLLRGAMDIEVRDIDSRADWLEKYDTRVPVVEYRDALISEYPLDLGAVAELLGGLPPEPIE